MKLVNWNVEWATPRSPRTAEMLSRIDSHNPDIVCFTEAHSGLLSRDGHTVTAQADYGYAISEHRRKVMLWSKEPWARVDDVGAESLTPGRFVSGVTQTSQGDVTVMGICIPWFGSRTQASRGLERKLRWQDHEEYLAALTELLRHAPTNRLIVMGDFNQVIGEGSHARRDLREALASAFPSTMRIVTADLVFEGRKSIDHIAVSEDLAVDFLAPISNVQGDKRLSDHFGTVAEIAPR